MGESAIEAALGPELARLVRAREARLTALREITTLRSPDRPRAAFLLEFSDGSMLKGRRLESAPRSAALGRLGAAIGPGFARIVAERGDAQLLDWVDGPALDSLASIPPEVLRRCGRLLGTLHRVDAAALEARDPAGAPLPRSADALQKLEQDAQALREARALDPALLGRALGAALASRPSQPALGIIHKDFCAANLVLDASGAPVCIDNDGFSLGPFDLDLARTWYRWPMDRASRSHFADGYQESRSLAGLLAHFDFWAICVLFGSAAWRLRMRVDGVSEPIARLVKLRAYLDGKSAGAEHPFWVI
jgi:aminoglycoside phosphotransferase (APT) family kinase protein